MARDEPGTVDVDLVPAVDRDDAFRGLGPQRGEITLAAAPGAVDESAEPPRDAGRSGESEIGGDHRRPQPWRKSAQWLLLGEASVEVDRLQVLVLAGIPGGRPQGVRGITRGQQWAYQAPPRPPDRGGGGGGPPPPPERAP